MIAESNLLPDDVCEIDGQPINDVSLLILFMSFTDRFTNNY